MRVLMWVGGEGVLGVSEGEREKENVQQTSFLWPRRTTHSFIERISNTRTV